MEIARFFEQARPTMLSGWAGWLVQAAAAEQPLALYETGAGMGGAASGTGHHGFTPPPPGGVTLYAGVCVVGHCQHCSLALTTPRQK